MVGAYIYRLIKTWGAIAFAISEALTFIVASISSSISIPSWVYWLIGTASFLIANFEIFRDAHHENERLQNLLAEIEGSEAVLVIRVNHSVFIHSAPILFFSGRFEDGLMPDGLPVEAIASAELEIHNLGEEEGELDWSLKLDECELPEIFEVKSESSGEIIDLPERLPGRTRLVLGWRLPCWMHEKNSYRFAEGLEKAMLFKFVIEYRTLRVGEPTEYRKATIEGGFDHYRSEIKRRWRESGHTELFSSDQ